MGFDVFLQRFVAGDPGPGDPDGALRVLAPYFVRPPEDRVARVRTADGEADVYGLGGDGLMFNHVSGLAAWDLIVQVARATGYVIMPVGCPVCVLDEDAIADLPLELRDTAVVVSSGADVLQAVTGPVEETGPQRGRGLRRDR